MDDVNHSQTRAMTGALWGTALGGALGLPYEGLSQEAVLAHGGGLQRYGLLGERGFVSDDTEQTVLVVESLVRGQDDFAQTVRGFRRALLGWCLRLPSGLGLATLRACLRIGLGLRASGVPSAGNGAAMRAGIIGVYFAHDAARRRAYAAALARVTHTDARAVEGALFSAELAALCASEPAADRAELALSALRVVRNRELYEALEGAVMLARSLHPASHAPNDGHVVRTLALCCAAFVASGASAMAGIQAAIRAGGDTDTAAAIVGCWLGALHGPETLPRELLHELAGGPFGTRHLAGLAEARASSSLPVWSPLRALLRNVALYPVFVAHWLSHLLRGHAFTTRVRRGALGKGLRA